MINNKIFFKYRAKKGRSARAGQVDVDTDSVHVCLGQDLLATAVTGPQSLGLCCVVACGVQGLRHLNLDSLKASVEEQWEVMDVDYIADVCGAFRCRVGAVIKADGLHVHK